MVIFETVRYFPTQLACIIRASFSRNKPFLSFWMMCLATNNMNIADWMMEANITRGPRTIAAGIIAPSGAH